MSKMLWELNVPIEVAKLKESVGYPFSRVLRYYKMYMERVKIKYKEQDLTFRLMYKYLFSGKIGIVKDPVYGLVVGTLEDIKLDPNGNITECSLIAENNYKRRNLKVDKDVVISYYDKTHVPPIIYLWGVIQQIIAREDIIEQQDNMLRKPIVVTGEGEDFDNAMNNAMNILSGVAFISTKANRKGNKGKNIMSDRGTEVLNLQVGNAYKGAELWDSRKHWEEIFCDYLGYTTTKNEKRERMNTTEVINENSIGMTFYQSFIDNLEEMIDKVEKVLGEKLELEKLLKGGEDYDNQKVMDRTDISEQRE